MLCHSRVRFDTNNTSMVTHMLEIVERVRQVEVNIVNKQSSRVQQLTTNVNHMVTPDRKAQAGIYQLRACPSIVPHEMRSGQKQTQEEAERCDDAVDRSFSTLSVHMALLLGTQAVAKNTAIAVFVLSARVRPLA